MKELKMKRTVGDMTRPDNWIEQLESLPGWRESLEDPAFDEPPDQFVDKSHVSVEFTGSIALLIDNLGIKKRGKPVYVTHPVSGHVKVSASVYEVFYASLCCEYALATNYLAGQGRTAEAGRAYYHYLEMLDIGDDLPWADDQFLGTVGSLDYLDDSLGCCKQLILEKDKELYFCLYD